MSALLDRYERQAVLLEGMEDVCRQNEDMFGDVLVDMRLPVSVRDALRRSRELRIEGVKLQAGFGPFWQMIDGSICNANQTAVTGTAEGAIWPVAQFTAFAANQLRGGQVWLLWAMGIMTTAGSSQGNLTLTPRYGTSSGGVALGASAATALAASAASVAWNLQYVFHVRKIGNAGTNSTAVGNGTFTTTIAAIAAATGNVVPFGSTADVSIDTSIAAGLYMGQTMGSASDTMTAMGVYLTSKN